MSDQFESRGTGFDAFGEPGDAGPAGGGPGPGWLEPPIAVVDRVLRVLLTLITVALLVAALVQVVTRYVLEVSLVGPEEIARYLMIAGTFLAIPVLARSRNHIAVDALRYYLPGRTTVVWLDRLILLIEIAFLLLFSYYAGIVVRDLHSTNGTSTGLEIPTWIPMTPVLVGALLGAVVTGVLLAQTFLHPRRTEPAPTVDGTATTDGSAR